MYKCNCCGSLKDELKEFRWNIENTPYYEDCVDNECSCGGCYEEAYECEDCGEYFTESELNDNLCAECLETYMTVENIVKFAEEYDCKDELLTVLKQFAKEDIGAFSEFIRSTK